MRDFRPCAPRDDPLMASIVRQAMEVCDCPFGVVSLVEEHEERFLATFGRSSEPVDRSASICAYAILEPIALVVEDLREDPRFCDHDWVTGKPYLRFYAGVPIFDATGLPLGAVCVNHTETKSLSIDCLLALEDLAAKAAAVLETRLLFAQTHSSHGSEEARADARSFLDARLLALVEPRPSCG